MNIKLLFLIEIQELEKNQERTDIECEVEDQNAAGIRSFIRKRRRYGRRASRIDYATQTDRQTDKLSKSRAREGRLSS